MKKIKGYRAKDGSFFNNAAERLGYELKLKVDENLKHLLEMIF